MSIIKKLKGLFIDEHDQFYKPKTMKLEIELVPKSMHGMNVRSRVTLPEWQQVCKVVHREANQDMHCEICNESGLKQNFSHPVEVHEQWAFDSRTHVQKLVGMVSICPLCHKAKHYGLAQKQGFGEATRKQLMKVNGVISSELDDYIQHAFKTVRERGNHEWSLDLTYLNKNEFGRLNIDFTEFENDKCDDIEF